MITKTFDSHTVNTDTPITYIRYESITSELDWRWTPNHTVTDNGV